MPRDPNKSPPPSGKSGRRHISPAAARSNEILAATDKIAVRRTRDLVLDAQIILAELRVLDRIDGGAAL